MSTAHGISDITYQSDANTILQGTGQGQALSGAIWSIHHSVLSDSFTAKAHGTWMIPPTGDEPIKSTNIGYVDDNDVDTNNAITSSNPTTSEIWQNISTISDEDIISAATFDTQWWMDLLQAILGKLSLEKSFSTTHKYTFDCEGRPCIQSIDATVNPIRLVNPEDNLSYPLKSKDSQKGHRTLGVWLAANGSTAEMHSELKQRNEKVISKISGIHEYYRIPTYH